MPTLPVRIQLAGVDVTRRVVWESTTITDQINADPNTAQLAIRGGAPLVGQVVRIGLGTFDPADLIFAGTVQAVGASYVTSDARPPVNKIWPCSLVDWTFTLNQRRPFGTWVATSATTIAQALVATYAPGFSSAGVVAGLPAVSIVFDGRQDFMNCLRQLATLINGYSDVGYDQVVKLFLDDVGAPPDPLDPGHPPANDPPLTFHVDGSQVRNRVYGRGHTESTRVDLPAGAAIVPIGDATQFSATGGQAIAGTTADGGQSQKLTYTGRELGTAKSSALGAVTAPGSAPAPSAAPGVRGDLIGVYQWAIAFAVTGGETRIGPVSAPLSVGLFGTPPASSASDSGVIGPLLGAYQYRATWITASGETLGGGAYGFTANVQPAPNGPNGTVGAGGPLVGNYSYRIGQVTPYGEILSTLASPNPIVCTNVVGPDVGGLNVISGTGTGNNWRYACTVVDADGRESTISNLTASGAVTSTNWSNCIVTQPAGMPATAVRWNLYRMNDKSGGTPLRLLASIPVATTTYSDVVGGAPTPEAQLGTMPPNPGNMGRSVSLSFIPTGPTGTTRRNIYRTKAGGSTYFLVGVLGDNTTTTFTDLAPDGALTQLAPAATTVGRTLTVGVPAGPTGTLARRIYRTKAGGSEYFFLAQLSDNTTASYTDGVADANLGAGLPLVSGADGGAANLTVPLGPAGTTERILYRTKAGGADLFYVGTIPDNATTAYVDTRGDGALGRTPVVVSTFPVLAGATAIDLVSTAGFPSSGWFLAGNQIARYTGIVGNTLTGIPASGPGSLRASIPAGSDVSPAPALVGVTGDALAMAAGTRIALWVEVNDLAAQADAAAIAGGGDGVREYLIDDATLDAGGILARCQADLAIFARPIPAVTYATRDLQTFSGKTVTVALGDVGPFDPAVFAAGVFDTGGATALDGAYTIQTVTLTFDRAAPLFPKRLVQAAAVRFTLQNLLRRAFLSS